MSLINFFSGLGGMGSTSKVKYLPENYIDQEDKKLAIQENHIHIYTCISIISNNFSKLKINVKKDSKIQRDHPLQYILNHQLNGYQNKQTVFSTLETHRNEYGNSLLWIESRKPYRFRILPPELIQDYEIRNGELIYRIVNITDHRYKDRFPTTIKAADVVHFRQISEDGVIGLSPLSAANASTEMLNNASSTINNFYKNGAITNLALESTFPNNDGAAKLGHKDRMEFKRTNAGVSNAGEIIKLPFGHKLTPLAVKFVDMELINTIKFSRDAICSMYNIPNSFLNEQDSVKDIEQDTLTFKSMCISPVANIYEQELMYKLLTKEEILEGYRLEFDLDSLVEIDTAAKVKIYGEALNKGAITPAQFSEKLGYSNDSEYAQKHYLQAQMIPLEHYDQYNPLLKNDPALNGINDNRLTDNENDRDKK